MIQGRMYLMDDVPTRFIILVRQKITR